MCLMSTGQMYPGVHRLMLNQFQCEMRFNIFFSFVSSLSIAINTLNNVERLGFGGAGGEEGDNSLLNLLSKNQFVHYLL